MCRDGFRGECPLCGDEVSCRESAEFMCGTCYDGCHEPELHDCGYVEDSFACKIRHQGPPIIGWGKAVDQ